MCGQKCSVLPACRVFFLPLYVIQCVNRQRTARDDVFIFLFFLVCVCLSYIYSDAFVCFHGASFIRSTLVFPQQIMIDFWNSPHLTRTEIQYNNDKYIFQYIISLQNPKLFVCSYRILSKTLVGHNTHKIPHHGTHIHL